MAAVKNPLLADNLNMYALAGFLISFDWSERKRSLLQLRFVIYPQESRIGQVVFAYLKGAQIHTEKITLQSSLKKPVLKVEA